MANRSPFRRAREREQFIAKYDEVMRGWPVPFTECMVETAFGQTHTVVCGEPSAPPLVLLHGASATSAMWRPVIAALSAQYRCYCLDTITDTSKSVLTSEISSPDDYVDWLRQVFDALGLTNARVVGLSYGGWLAAQLGLRAPELVSHLVLLTPAGTLAPLTIQFYVRMMTPILLRSPARVRAAVQWLASTPDACSDPTVKLIVVSMLTSRPFRRPVLPSVLTDAELRRLTMPVTVVIGDRDVIYRGGPVATLARARRLIPQVSTRSVPGANHMLTVDCPDELITELTRALA